MLLANRITVIRILAIPFFIICLMYYVPQKDYLRYLALLIFVFAVLTDGIDGLIARRESQRSELGAYLDPIADKLLLVTAFISLSIMKNLPPKLNLPGWATMLVISRDCIIILGSVLIYLIKGKFKISPRLLGKCTTFFQMLTIVSILSGFVYWNIILYLAVIFTVLSGIDYIRQGSLILSN